MIHPKYAIVMFSVLIVLFSVFSLVAFQTLEVKHEVITHRALVRDVYGFWPYWVNPDNYQPKWGDLTYIMYFSMTARSDGSLDSSNMSNYQEVYSEARKHNVSIAIVVSSYNQNVQDSILAYHRMDFVNSILNMLSKYGADGVLIDFPQVHDTNTYTGDSNKPLWGALMETLYNAVKYKNASYLVSFSTSGAIPNSFRNSTLAQYVDSIYMYGYEFHWAAAPTTGPIAPYNDSKEYDINDAVTILENYYPRWKIVLGVPLYGYEWPASSDQPGASTLGVGSEYPMWKMIDNAKEYGRIWDSSSNTPYYVYQVGDTWYQGWYEDTESLKLKWEFVIREGLGGTGLWSLSNEDPSIWGEITSIFWHSTHSLTRIVYAFYPYWINATWYFNYPDESQYNPDMWKALTYVAYSELHARGDGTLDESNMTWYNQLYSTAKSHGVNVTLSIANTNPSNDRFNADIANQILAYHRTDFANNVLAMVQKYHADGVCIDFEGIQMNNPYSSYNNSFLFEDLMYHVYTTLKSANPNYHVSFCVAYFIDDVFRNPNLANYIDDVFLMGYDYYLQDPTHTGPVAPYNDPTRFDVVDSVNILEKYFPKWKIILGVPFYGRQWLCNSDKPGANATYGAPILMKSAVHDAQIYGRKWDSNSHTPYYEYYGSNGYWHQIWYDDSESLSIKWKYVINMGLAGTGIWSLGSEDKNIWYTILNLFSESQPASPTVSEFPHDCLITIFIIFVVITAQLERKNKSG